MTSAIFFCIFAPSPLVTVALTQPITRTKFPSPQRGRHLWTVPHLEKQVYCGLSRRVEKMVVQANSIFQRSVGQVVRNLIVSVAHLYCTSKKSFGQHHQSKSFSMLFPANAKKQCCHGALSL